MLVVTQMQATMTKSTLQMLPLSPQTMPVLQTLTMAGMKARQS
jgi:hypothetical protein